MSEHPPGWYPDSENGRQVRYWDGSKWTELVASADTPNREGGAVSPRGFMATSGAWMKGHKKTTAAGVAALLFVGITAVGADSEDSTTEPSAKSSPAALPQVPEETQSPSPSAEEVAAAAAAAKTAEREAKAEARRVAKAKREAAARKVAAKKAKQEQRRQAAAAAQAEQEAAAAQAEQEAAANVYYENCSDVEAAGAAPIYAGDPGYSRDLDRDGDGVACEQ